MIKKKKKIDKKKKKEKRKMPLQVPVTPYQPAYSPPRKDHDYPLYHSVGPLSTTATYD